jgi:multidrug efflux pump
MSLSTPFINRPVGTTLLTLAILLAGALGYVLLPVSPLPQVDFPTIQVQAALPGASPETMASAVATPLERQFARIAGITEMTSQSTLGATQIVIQFELDRDINAAARDVQAAINAARGRLPPNLPTNPSYRKVNPADAPIMILSVKSHTYSMADMYDAASTILQQKLSQVPGVGQVFVGGSAPPGVRIDINPTVLHHYGIVTDQVRAAVGSANANLPKGSITGPEHAWSISTTDQLMKAEAYKPLIVSYRNGAPVRLGEIARVYDSVEDIRTGGNSGGQPAVSIIVFRQPGANIVATVERIKALLPQLDAQIPADMELGIADDRTTVIRASIEDVQFSLILSVGLVILVVFLFLRDVRATFIPSVAVPVSLVGTFGVMYLCGYSLDNLSLMALTIATGFVVDDAIVVIENITRHLEEGLSPMEAALKGAAEIGFTVLSISISLVAVFIPILLMGGIVGRLFQEFAVTLSVAIGVSLVVSLTTTAMMCAWMLKSKVDHKPGRLFLMSERIFDGILYGYEWSLMWMLRHHRFTMLLTLATIGLTGYLYVIVPKGFFPQQDAGRLTGNLNADQDVSFPQMQRLMAQFSAIVDADPAVDKMTGYVGGGRSGQNTARMFITLKPFDERTDTAADVIVRLRKATARIPGATLFLQAVQDLRIGGFSSSAQYQYTLRGDNLDDLKEWGPKMLNALRQIRGLTDVNSDQYIKGLKTSLTVDRVAAARLGLTQQMIDDALYNAFGQRQVSTIYKQKNQYHVTMEVEPEFWQNPDALRYIYLPGLNGAQIPLSAIATHTSTNTAIAVPHAGMFPSVTFSFNLDKKMSLGEAVEKIQDVSRELGLPESIHGNFQGTAAQFQSTLSTQPLLILAALVAVYIVLGILYESYIHPITILSTLPSAGVGALLALLWCEMELNVIAIIGILLLIGIVKKNAIMMIDFALEAERNHGKAPEDAIFEACILRFRPITMTTMAALLGGLPLAIGTGAGSELRQPMGVAIVGGLIFSQALTLYTTPVVYLYLDRFRLWWTGGHDKPLEPTVG